MSTTRRSTSKSRPAEEKERAIEVINRQRGRALDQPAVARLSRQVLKRIGNEDAELTIIFVRDRLMRALNRDYRGLDQPTDVLSFAYHEGGEVVPAEFDSRHLGDVVISVETAARYAAELGLTFDREIEYLIIHGILHIAGYDHETDHGEMNRLERKLRRELLP